MLVLKLICKKKCKNTKDIFEKEWVHMRERGEKKKGKERKKEGMKSTKY